MIAGWIKQNSGIWKQDSSEDNQIIKLYKKKIIWALVTKNKNVSLSRVTLTNNSFNKGIAFPIKKKKQQMIMQFVC